MAGCDARPGYPLDRTVRGDRRPCDPFGRVPPWPAEAAVRRRAGVPGGGAGAAGRPQRAPLAAAVLRAARAPVPVPAETARLPQAAEGSRAAAGRGDRSPGPPVAVLVRPGAADRRDPGAVRRLPGDGPALRAGRVGALRLLRGAFALVLGAEAVPDHHPGRDAGGVVPGRPEDRRTRGCRRAAGLRRPHRRPAAGPDADRGQGVRGPGVRGPGHRRVPSCTWSARTGATRRPATGPSAGSGSGSNRSTTPSKASSTSNGTAAGPPRACTPGSPSGCWPWPPASGTTRLAVADRRATGARPAESHHDVLPAAPWLSDARRVLGYPLPACLQPREPTVP